MVSLPVEQDDGCVLFRLDPVHETHLNDLDPAIPLTASLVVLWDAGECLLVFNRFRQIWELPGGMIDPGESARDAAVRELLEESGQRADTLALAGVARTWYPPANRLEHLAIYCGTVASRSVFVENDEMTQSLWWDGTADLPDFAPIDRALAEMCGPAGLNEPDPTRGS
jgi:8-oxo-dGTP diphosphatase